MALTCQSIANDVNIEMRQYFAALNTDVGADLMTGLFIPWIDQVHKDALHTSIWSPLSRVSETFQSAVGGSPYVLTANDIRHIIGVYDVTHTRWLIPYQDINFATGSAEPNNEKSGPPRAKQDQTQQTNANWPQYYIVEACATGTYTWAIHLLPDPPSAEFIGTLRYHYMKEIATLTDPGDSLVIPEDGRAMMVAGVAALAAQYINPSSPRVAFYSNLYTNLKRTG